MGLLESNEIPTVLERITICDSLAEAVEGVSFVTEAAWEDLEVKQELFGQLEALVDPETILASNSSSFKITDTAAGLSHAQRAVVTHWFNPPHVIPVVEVVGGEQTSEETVTTSLRVLEEIGKMAIRVDKELTGFLVNRVQVAMAREVWDLLDRQVATAEEIDRAIRGSMGLRLAALGPLAINDYAGWDIASATYKNLIPDMRSDFELPGRVRQLVEDGHLGAKSGQGLFSYPPAELPGQVASRDASYLSLVRLLHAQLHEEDGDVAG